MPCIQQHLPSHSTGVSSSSPHAQTQQALSFNKPAAPPNRPLNIAMALLTFHDLLLPYWRIHAKHVNPH